MASIRKVKSGWRAEVFRKGTRKSKILPTQREAKDWAARAEYEILNGDKIAAKLTLRELFDRYAREVSPTKAGRKWEVVRLEKLQRDPIARIQLADISATDLADWRDRRVREVSAGSVLREMSLLSAVFTQARKEWRLLSHNPLTDVRKPKRPAARTRLPDSEEIERLQHVAGADLTTATGRVFHAFLFAGETAMRAGEIVGLEWQRLDLEKRVAHIPMTKNGTARDVPLSSEAVRLIKALPEADPVFDLSSRQLDALWRKTRDKALIDGLTFHDSRAWALTKLARKVDVMTLAKISGHRDLKILLNTYYRETAEDIAKRLD
ncbi:site-specific integrase [Tropicibacter sp. R15_0]|uniref:tyrosine-type recombinase/integrase n=1 Tax=Tropicibacter sp. R15_0 TaxID=2821101 RepID=UPI001AD9CDEB|nr:tyrosine-type recombinase/integrase [Tropicibacter sp. R15_0]MBO9467035.1 site-specific integrase [Tropicibacter sp. R15_0]